MDPHDVDAGGAGWVIVTGDCVQCGRSFSFNPHKVPSVRVAGERKPICRGCVEWANPLRKEKGLPEIEILPGAYDPMPAEQL